MRFCINRVFIFILIFTFLIACLGAQHNSNMVRITGGTFTIGSPANETGRRNDESQRQVTVTGFYMGRYEVTQKEYEEVTGINPGRFWGVNLPVEQVTWFDAVEYCNKRSQKEGLTPVYTITGRIPATGYPITAAIVTINWDNNGYRLPTEAEWEYACRAGTVTAFNTGAGISDNTGWYAANSNNRTHHVGQKQANAWGLYDMHGNVWEWCWDWYDNYAPGARTDPRGPDTGILRTLRGGSWGAAPSIVRSAYRFSYNPYARSNSIGFRVVHR